MSRNLLFIRRQLGHRISTACEPMFQLKLCLQMGDCQRPLLRADYGLFVGVATQLIKACLPEGYGSCETLSCQW